MENLDTENNDKTYTPEELAWNLIMDEHIESSQMLAFCDENTKEMLFEILITIYLEMIFNYYKLQYLENTINDENDEKICDEFDNFILDLSKVDINMLTGIFKEKFSKLKFILNVIEIEKKQYEFFKIHRYCNIMLKDSPFDNTYFLMNADYLDPIKRYHFVLNSLYTKSEDLRNIFATVTIYGKHYKIYFNTF
jgi:uncharacterized protein YrzB (UPF0473 family)